MSTIDLGEGLGCGAGLGVGCGGALGVGAGTGDRDSPQPHVTMATIRTTAAHLSIRTVNIVIRVKIIIACLDCIMKAAKERLAAYSSEQPRHEAHRRYAHEPMRPSDDLS